MKAVIELQPVFVNQLQQNFQIEKREPEKLVQKKTNLLNVSKVTELLSESAQNLGMTIENAVQAL